MTREARLWLVFLLALSAFVCAVVGMTTYTLWLLRVDAISSSFQKSALMARSFETFLTQTLNATSLAVEHAVPEGYLGQQNSQLEGSLGAILRTSPQVRSLSLLNEAGQIVASSNHANIGLTIATHDYFPPAQAAAKVLRVGTPWLGRDFAQGNLPGSTLLSESISSFVPVAQKLDANSRLTLLIALNPDYFLNHMSKQLGEEAGSVDVLRLDGVRLMSSVMDVGTKTTYSKQVQGAAELEFGEFAFEHSQLGPSLSAFRVSSLYPLMVVTHLQRELALQRWMTEVKFILGAVLPTLLAICVLSVAVFRRQLLLRAQRAESERLQRINAACVFTNTREGIIIADADGAMLDVNDAFTRITGYSREEVLGKNPRILASGRHDKAYYAAMWAELGERGHWSGEVWNRRKDGGVFAELLTISAVCDSQGKVQQFVAVFSNITSIKEYQHELEHIARYDALTNLPNRMLLADRLRQAMAQAQRREQKLALVFIDLDGFKAINDKHGHDAGDHLLITVANRMKQALRDGDTLARQGGDEFVALLVDLPHELDCVPLLKRLLDAAAQKVEFAGLDLHVSASLGVSFYSKDLDIDRDELMHQADQAMYQAKQAGKNRYQLFGFESTNPLQSPSAC